MYNKKFLDWVKEVLIGELDICGNIKTKIEFIN